MERIKNSSAVASLPTVSSSGTAGYFRDPADGVQTIVTNDWANGVQEELIAVIEAAGLTPDINDNKQLLKSIRTNLNNYETTTGSANAYVLTFETPFTAYTEGMIFRAKIHAPNTGASTINIDGLGIKDIKLFGGVALVAGELPLNYQAMFTYDGTNVVLLNPAPISFSASVTLSGAQSIPGGNVSTLVNFDTVEYDPLSLWDNTLKRFVPARLGRYRLSSSLYFAAPSNGSVFLTLFKNGSEARRISELATPGPNDCTPSGSTILTVSSGTDYFDVRANNAGASASNAGGGGAVYSCFQIEYLGT